MKGSSSSKRRKTSSASTQRKTERLNCRIDKGLYEWIQWFARQRRTTVTQLVVDYFQGLKRQHEQSGISEVDQF